MTILCTVCGYDKTPDASEFCDACGAELAVSIDPVTDGLSLENKPETNPDFGQEISFQSDQNLDNLSLTKSEELLIGRLIAKQNNAPTPEFSLENYNLIGIFDPDTGPVDLDLEEFMGNETVSRQHAEIYQESGVWKIKDLGSTNGVFIRPLGQKRFSARITSPTIINHGDEIAIAKIQFLFQTS
jgi:pSer/pThr/pTyr-binding forkhead associated (FHA) protein